MRLQNSGRPSNSRCLPSGAQSLRILHQGDKGSALVYPKRDSLYPQRCTNGCGCLRRVRHDGSQGLRHWRRHGEVPKPGASDSYDVMAQGAAKSALKMPASISGIQQVYAGYVFGDSTCGQRAVYPTWTYRHSLSSTSTTTARLDRRRCFWRGKAVMGGRCRLCARARFEQMEKGALGSKWTDRTNPMDKRRGDEPPAGL